MRKLVKIICISLASILGLVAVVAGVLVYLVFTPDRLTPIVKNVADDYIGCEYEIGAIDLTFFSTFPEFGLRADGILIVNPTEGAPSDTVLYAEKVVARVDIEQLLNEGCLNIHEVALQGVEANAFIAADGRTNLDFLTLPEDTTEEDTTSTAFIKTVKVEDLRVLLDAKHICFVDEKDSISAHLIEPTIALEAKPEQEQPIAGLLDIKMPSLSAHIGDEDYASDANISLHLPFRLDLEMPTLGDIMQFKLYLDNGAKLSVNEFDVALSGLASLVPTIDMNLDLETNSWHLSDLLALVPQSIFTMPADITADGDLRLSAHVEGTYNDSTMPLVDAHLLVEDATGALASLPYTLTDVKADIDAHVDLNEEKNTSATIRSLSAKTKKSSVTATGTVADLMNSMLLDLVMQLDVNLPDADYFLPDNMDVAGRAKGTLAAKITLDDLSNVRLEKGKINANLTIANLSAKMDEMAIRSKDAKLLFHIPNSKMATGKPTARLKKVPYLDGTLTLSDLNVAEEGSLRAVLGETNIDLMVSDVINQSKLICADLDVKTTDLDAGLVMTDSLGQTSEAAIKASAPKIKAYVEYDTKDTTKVPILDCNFAFSRLDAVYDTIEAHLTAPSGVAKLTEGKRDKKQPHLEAEIKAKDLDAKMGEFVQATTGTFAIAASAQHTNNTENILLEWMPRLKVDLKNGHVRLDGFDEEIRIPAIEFAYSNRQCTIDTSRIELGHSNFSLSGEVRNIGKWLRKDSVLRGDLYFYSSNADINELLTYMSGSDEDYDEETEPTSESTSEGAPFIVPKKVDVTLHTHIARAEAFGQQLNNLGGNVHVKNGVLVVEEVGFICNAAKLQLTAMYKTPRRNHTFVGLDYHMVDIDIAQLVDMIPQVDEMLPMLRAFSGDANFHLAAETYINDKYQIKPSTTRASCSITANHLNLKDNDTFTKIAKILTFNKKDAIVVDSISAEIALYKEELDIYPFLVQVENWKAAVGGTQNLDMTCDYHVSLLRPFYLGVDIKGAIDGDLSIKPAKCRYAQEFQPIFRRQVDTQSADIRKKIKAALQKAMK